MDDTARRDPAASPTAPRPRRRRLVRLAAWAASLLVLTAVLLTVRDRARDLEAAALPSLWPVLTAGLLYVVANSILAEAWRRMVALHGARLERSRGAWIWSASQLSRYGFSFAQAPSRVALAALHGVPPAAAAVAGLLELVWVLALLSAVALATTPWWLPGSEQLLWLALLAIGPVGVLVASVAAPGRVLAALRPITQRLGGLGGAATAGAPPPASARGALLPILALYVTNSALRIGAFLVLFHSLVDGAGASTSIRAVGAVAVGNLAGAVAFFAPGGLGVREATVALGLTPLMGAGPAVSLAIAIRIIELGSELAVLAGAWLAHRRHGGGRRVTGGRGRPRTPASGPAGTDPPAPSRRPRRGSSDGDP